MPRGAVAGTILPGPYRIIFIDRKGYRAGRLAFLYMKGAWPEQEVDHIDTDKKNDRWSNLRLVTRIQNLGNKRTYKSNKLGVKGVFLRPDNGMYHAQIQHEGKKFHLGDHTKIEDAKEAYRKAAVELFGEYHRTG